jgi:hypothetical protein
MVATIESANARRPGLQYKFTTGAIRVSTSTGCQNDRFHHVCIRHAYGVRPGRSDRRRHGVVSAGILPPEDRRMEVKPYPEP